MHEARGDEHWRAALERLGAAAGPSMLEGAEPRGGRASQPLALQFELRRRVQPRVGEWRGRRDEPARRAASVDRLAVRPVTRGARGGWVKGGLTWQNIAYQSSTSGFDAGQTRWFTQFVMLKGTTPGVYGAYGSDWLTLDEFESPLLWALLTDARRLGIDLCGADAATAVRVAGSAAIELDASRLDGRRLGFEPRLRIDGHDRSLAAAKPIGDHGVYTFDFDAGVIELAALAETRSGAWRDLLVDSRAIVVPADDEADFLASHYGTVAALASVTSRDGSFTPPEPPVERELTGVLELRVTTVESHQRDWFDLGVFVTVDGRAIPFMPLFRALATGQRRLKLVDKTYLQLNRPEFARLRELLEEAGTLAEWQTGVRIHRSRTSLWADFEDLADIAEPAVSWRQTVAGLEHGEVEALPQPDGVAVALRPYQLDGFRWLAFLHSMGLGGILADDMGLGKTAQVLALVAHTRERSSPDDAPRHPFLVVAPTSVASNWAREAERFTPELRVARVTSTERTSGTTIADAAAGADLIITTYAILRLEADAFAEVRWSGLVLDEAQFVKNPATRVHEAAAAIRADTTIAVTGTPIENSLSELWSILQLVAPGLFPSRRRFDEHYRRPIENEHSVERRARLQRRIRPLLLRRTKEAVAPELPEKVENVLGVELHPEHRRLYDATLQRERQKLLGLVDDLDRSRFIVYRSLTLLRMLALDASLIDERHRGVPSAKLDVLFEQLDEVLAEGHRVLVFSQFTSFLDRVSARLDATDTAYAHLDGSTPAGRRDLEIAKFRAGEASVFLISLKAGGFGLNLTEADHVFLLDPWWNPATEAQAIDRVHRIGQTSRVMVHRLVADDTVEAKIMALKAAKGALVDGVLGDLSDAALSDAARVGERVSAADGTARRSAGSSVHLTADDLRTLLEE